MRVVLDTNTLISALLFSGTAARLVPAWQSGRIMVLLSRAILEEYLRALSYPKFRLDENEMRSLIEEELLPWVETVLVKRRITAVKQDPDDDKFLECAVSGKAAYVVSGDGHLLEIGSFRGIEILRVSDFLELPALRS